MPNTYVGEQLDGLKALGLDFGGYGKIADANIDLEWIRREGL